MVQLQFPFWIVIIMFIIYVPFEANLILDHSQNQSSSNIDLNRTRAKPFVAPVSIRVPSRPQNASKATQSAQTFQPTLVSWWA
jgi:hypothetical protein